MQPLPYQAQTVERCRRESIEFALHWYMCVCACVSWMLCALQCLDCCSQTVNCIHNVFGVWGRVHCGHRGTSYISHVDFSVIFMNSRKYRTFYYWYGRLCVHLYVIFTNPDIRSSCRLLFWLSITGTPQAHTHTVRDSPLLVFICCLCTHSCVMFHLSVAVWLHLTVSFSSSSKCILTKKESIFVAVSSISSYL